VSASSLSGTVLLCLVVFASTVCVGAFGPLLPEIARAQGLPDWQLGILAGSFGFARMAADLPAGALATRHLATSLTLAPITLLAGMLLQAGWTLTAVKLVVIGLLIFFASPTATHALANAALARGVKLEEDGEASSKR